MRKPGGKRTRRGSRRGRKATKRKAAQQHKWRPHKGTGQHWGGGGNKSGRNPTRERGGHKKNRITTINKEIANSRAGTKKGQPHRPATGQDQPAQENKRTQTTYSSKLTNTTMRTQERGPGQAGVENPENYLEKPVHGKVAMSRGTLAEPGLKRKPLRTAPAQRKLQVAHTRTTPHYIHPAEGRLPMSSRSRVSGGPCEGPHSWRAGTDACNKALTSARITNCKPGPTP